MEPQRRAPPPGFSGRPQPQPSAPEAGAPLAAPVNLGGFGLGAGPSPLMRMLNASQGTARVRSPEAAPPPPPHGLHAPPPHMHGPPGGGYGYPPPPAGLWGAPGGPPAGQFGAPAGHVASVPLQHVLPPYAPPLPPGYPPHMRMPQPLQGAPPQPVQTLMHDDGTRFIMRAAPGGVPPSLQPGVIGEVPPELRAGGDGGALLRLLQQRPGPPAQSQQAQHQQPPLPRAPYGDMGGRPANAAAAAAAAQSALAGLRLGGGPPATMGSGAVHMPAFGAIGSHITPPAGGLWQGPPPQQQGPPAQMQGPPPPRGLPPAPRPPQGPPPGMAVPITAPMAMPPPPATAHSPGGGDALARSPPLSRVNQREVREADQAARAADRDERGGRGGGGSARRGGATLKADGAALSAQLEQLAASLQPAAEDTARQAACFERVRALVTKEWPDCQLLMYGSCANGFGGRSSDIDTCLALKWADSAERKRTVVQRIAELAEAGGYTNVVALTHARMPVAKMVEPTTGVACDVCVNNFLAVFNTRLLRDYAAVDPRLRPLGYAVKHWAKRRCVNEPYTGTLSSYCYILMCIHLLQTRSPPVLPCLQAMTPHTFTREVDGTRCGYYDDVRALQGWGARNTHSLAELLAEFFDYWAHGHDYGGSVASVRVGGFIGKRRKGWTTRVGTERHLICIEDPFEVSHDLGRVVDKRSINVLRDEFARAAQILRTNPVPLEQLFQEYQPPPPARAPGAAGKRVGGDNDDEDEAAAARRLGGALPDSL